MPSVSLPHHFRKTLPTPSLRLEQGRPLALTRLLGDADGDRRRASRFFEPAGASQHERLHVRNHVFCVAFPLACAAFRLISSLSPFKKAMK